MAHILIIDDSELNSMILAHRLKANGFSVDVAGENSKALEKARNLPNNSLIIIDRYIQEPNEFKTIEKIKNDQSTTHIPVIAFSKTLMQEDFEYAKQLGCDEICKRDIEELDELTSTIHTLLNQKKIKNAG
ncbi:MAG: response regulator [Oligoflexales bacterium]|nr:response regulator [Oligoflexales bacterium]